MTDAQYLYLKMYKMFEMMSVRLLGVAAQSVHEKFKRNKILSSLVLNT